MTKDSVDALLVGMAEAIPGTEKDSMSLREHMASIFGASFQNVKEVRREDVMTEKEVALVSVWERAEASVIKVGSFKGRNLLWMFDNNPSWLNWVVEKADKWQPEQRALIIELLETRESRKTKPAS